MSNPRRMKRNSGIEGSNKEESKNGADAEQKKREKRKQWRDDKLEQGP